MVDFAAGDVQTVTLADVGAALVTGKLGFGEVKESFFDTAKSAGQPSRIDSTRTISMSLFGGSDSSPASAGGRQRRASTGGIDSSPSRRERRAAAAAAQGMNTMSMADWAASTIGLESAPPAARAASMGGTLSMRSLPSNRPNRKRADALETMSLSQVLDEAAEKALNNTVEQPVCMESCMRHPRCMRICYPAEHATRQKRGRQETKTKPDPRSSSAASHGEDGAGLHLPNFGFPDMEQAGYSMIAPEDSELVDPLVMHVLGLQVVVHKKTSLQRFCLMHPKAKLLGSTGSTELKGLFRSLKRCDHANVLAYIDCYEDVENLYLMYEYFPCVTLRYVMETQSWTQEHLVNMIREICAAVGAASSTGMVHLGWTLCHVLVPASSANGGDPMLCKIFGFGLMGVLYNDTPDHMCWAPEALERYNQQGKDGNFVQKMETHMRHSCDSWSVGVLAFTLVAKQPPFTAEQMILLRRWQFTLAIDMMDVESKSLIEGFLSATTDRRLRPDRALHHEWLRRRWRPPAGGQDVLVKLEEFCMSPLPKRLFGRFLVNFLESEHFRRIAKYFYSLDMQGTGSLSLRELEIVAKLAGRPSSTALVIFNWLAPPPPPGAPPGTGAISLSRFVECYAEDVIDGRALRHAFESLDDDGSEEVGPEELFGALQLLDDTEELTVEEVVEYIEACEGGASGGADQNHQIDYQEFCELFPVRVKRVQAMTDRIDSERQLSDELKGQFDAHATNFQDWVSSLDKVLKTISTLSAQTLDRTDAGQNAARALRKEFNRIDELLTQPPGPAAEKEFQQLVAQQRKLQLKQQHRKHDLEAKVKKDVGEGKLFGFDSFIQDQALIESFSTLISNDLKMLKQALAASTKLSNRVDQVKAHDAAENVCRQVGDALKKAKGQLSEYQAFAEAMGAPEAALLAGVGGVQLSGRGLRTRCGEADDDPLGGGPRGAELEETSGNPMMRFIAEVTQRFTGR